MSPLIKVGVNWSWRERSFAQSSQVTIISRERAQPRHLATRNYQQVDYAILVAIITVSIAAQLDL